MSDEISLDIGVPREIASNEVSIAKWSQGDPVRALAKASELAEERRHLVRQLRNAEEMVEARVRELQAWLAGRREHVERRLRWIDNILRGYQLDFHPKERTTVLPYGVKLVRRKARPTREWDTEAALRWQEERYPEDVRRVLAKDALLQRLSKRDDGTYVDAATGEIVEFVREVPPAEPETFVVEQEEEG